MSKDGETIIFEEIMKARLGVDHWVKCIGLHVRSTMREMSRKFPHETIRREEILDQWKSESACSCLVLIVTLTSCSQRKKRSSERVDRHVEMKDTGLKGLFCLAFKNVWTVRISVISSS